MREGESDRTIRAPARCRLLAAAVLPRRVADFGCGNLDGLAYVRGPVDRAGMAGASRRWWDAGWRVIGPTAGSLTVPAGNQLKVQLRSVPDPASLSCLERCGAQVLSLAGAGSAVEALAHLRNLDGLRALDLWSVPVDDDVLGGVWDYRWMEFLEGLNLWGTLVSDAGLAALAARTRLRRLHVPGRRTGDAAMACLADMTSLRELDLGGSSVTDEGLLLLAGAPNLTRLSLWGTGISDEGLAILASFPRLTELDLGSTPMTDAGLHHLQLPQFKRICLLDSLVTPDGVRQLKAELPGCQIEPAGTRSGWAGLIPPPAAGRHDWGRRG
ncbi:MAG: hypothetical protein ACRDJU_10165 [Actinomycetota bacterium]